jgi:hypothetical protein
MVRGSVVPKRELRARERDLDEFEEEFDDPGGSP